MKTDHVKDYFAAMSAKKISDLGQHLADDVVLLSPILAEPFQGKDAVVAILAGLIETIDGMEINLTFASGRDVAVFFTIECEGITVKGNEHIHLDENGCIDLFEVAWRPLAAAVLIQEKLAAKLGGQPMRLVPASGAN